MTFIKFQLAPLMLAFSFANNNLDQDKAKFQLHYLAFSNALS